MENQVLIKQKNNKQIIINEISVRLKQMYKQHNSKSQLINGVTFQLLSSNLIQLRSAKPIWISQTAILFLSGCNILKYDFVGQEFKQINQKHSLVEEKIYLFKGFKNYKNQISYVYITNHDNYFYKIYLRSDKNNLKTEIILNNSKFQIIKDLVLLDQQTKFLLVTQNKSDYILTIGEISTNAIIITKLLPKSINWKIFDGFTNGTIIIIQKRTIRLASYCEQGIRQDVITPLKLQQDIIEVQFFVEFEKLVVVTANSILFIMKEQKKFKMNKILFETLKFPEKHEIVSVNINYNSIFLYQKLTKSFYIIKLDLNYIDSYTTQYIDLSDQIGNLTYFIVSPNNQNIILFAQDLSHNHTIFHFSVQLYITKQYHQKNYMVKTIFHPDNYEINSISLSLLRQKPIVLAKNKIFIGLDRKIQFQDVKCCDMDSLGLYLIVGLEYCFKIFAIKSFEFVMMYSQPISNIIKIKYNIFGEIFIVLLKNQFIIYNSNKYQRILTYTSDSKSDEYLNFQINQDGHYALFYHSDGHHFIFNLVTFTKISTFKYSFPLSIFRYDFYYNMLINYQQNHHLHIYDPNTQTTQIIQYLDNVKITAIEICNDLQLIYFGTHDGRIRAHLWPVCHPSQFINNYTEIKLFICKVSNILLSKDRSIIYISSADGNFVILKLQYFQQGNPICKEILINKIEERGIGFYKYYMDSLILESKEENQEKDNEIKNLEYQKQRRGVIYKQSVTNVQMQNTKRISEMKQGNRSKFCKIEQIESKKNEILKRLKVYENENYIKQSIRNIEQEFTKKYINIVDKNSQLQQVLNALSQKYKNQFNQQRKIYQNKINQSKKFYQKYLDSNHKINKNQNEINIQEIQQFQQEYKLLITTYNDNKLVEQLENQKSNLFNQNDKLRVKIKLNKIESSKFECKIYQSKQILKKLEQDLQVVKLEANKKRTLRAKLEKQLFQFQRVLEDNQSKEKSISKKAARYSQNTSSLIYDLQNLQNLQILKMKKELQDSDKIFEQVQKNLTDQALLSKKYNQQIQQYINLKNKLKNKYKEKKNKSRQLQYKLRTFGIQLEKFKASLIHKQYRIKHNKNNLDQIINITNKQQNKIQNMKFFEEKNLETIVKKGSKRMQNHLRQNEILIEYLNNLSFVYHNNQKILNNVKKQYSHVNSNKSENVEQIEKKDKLQLIKKTPFERYHDTKLNKLTKFVKKPNVEMLSKSSKNSIWDKSLSIQKISKSIYNIPKN